MEATFLPTRQVYLRVGLDLKKKSIPDGFAASSVGALIFWVFFGGGGGLYCAHFFHDDTFKSVRQIFGMFSTTSFCWLV